MKLGKMSRLILGLGILVITLGSLGVARSQQANEAKLLSENLTIANTRLSKLDLKDLVTQQETLTAKLSNVTAEMDTARAYLSVPNDSITVSEAVFRTAYNAGVEIIQIASQGLSTAKINGVVCLVQPVSVQVTGNLPNVIDFIMQLNKDFPTGMVKSGQIMTGGKSTESDNTTPEEGSLPASDNTTGGENELPPLPPPAPGKATAQVQISLYAYKR